MTSIANVHDTGAYVSSTLLTQVQTAAATINSASLDTIPNNSQELGSAIIQCDATIATYAGGETSTLTLTLQDAADDGAGAPVAFADVAAGVLMGAADGADGLPTNPVISLEEGVTATGSFSFNVPLQRLRRHVRVVSTWATSGAGTTDYHVAAISGGNTITPV